MIKRNKLFRAVCSLGASLAVILAMPLQAAAAVTVQGSIAYIYDNQVWVSRADGQNAMQLTNDNAQYVSPALSPDGTLVAVERWEGETASRIYIVPVNGDAMYRLSMNYKDYQGVGDVYEYVGNQYRPRWNPDGSRVSFYTREFAQEGSDPYRVYDAPLNGEGKEYRNGMYPAYSPDGTKIAYLAYDPVGIDYYWRVRVIDLLTNAITEVHRTQNVLGSFSWSPDSNKIVVQETQAEVLTGIRIIDATRDYSMQSPELYTDEVYTFVEDVSWSPNGNFIALIGQDNELVQDVLLFSVASGTFSSVTNTPDDTVMYRFPIWDATTRYLLVTYNDTFESPPKLAIVDTVDGAVHVMQSTSFMQENLRDVKDWRAQFVAPVVPQVLGTSTDELPATSNGAKPAVLGATTLPATGSESVQKWQVLGMLFSGCGLLIIAMAHTREKATSKK